MQTKSWREVISKTRIEFKLLGGNGNTILSDRYIMSELQSSSLVLIKQATDKRKLWSSDNIFTTLPCLKMVTVPLGECCSYTSDCDISRTEIQLPRIAEGTNFGMLIKGVWSVDIKSTRFYESDANRYANSLNLGLLNKSIQYWIQNRYIYTSSPNLKSLTLAAYFEEDIPDSLNSYPSYCGTTLTKGCCSASDKVATIGNMTKCCPPNPLDLEVTIPGYMVDDTVKMVAKKLIETYGRVPNLPTDGIPESKK